MKCCVYVCQDNKNIMMLGAGMDAVIRFSEMADKGIQGSTHTEKGWYCNRDVLINGEALLEFIKNAYHDKYSEGLDKINKELNYLIISYDFS